MSVIDIRQADPELPIVRRVRFDYHDVPVHWVEGRPLVTHIANVFNILLPPGERWFCRSFREALPQVTDEVLRDQVKAFIGQESIHGRSHHAYCDKLQADGIPVLDLMAEVEEGFNGPGDALPIVDRLWLIAGIEVYTAMLGRYVYDTDVFADAHPVMRDLLLWHLAEEIEHKSVAFDLAQAIEPNYRRRVRTGVMVTVMMLTLTIRLLLRLIAADPELSWGRAAKETWRERAHLAGLFRYGSRSFRQYLRRDHHPSQEADPPAALAYFAESPAVVAAAAVAAVRIPATRTPSPSLQDAPVSPSPSLQDAPVSPSPSLRGAPVSPSPSLQDAPVGGAVEEGAVPAQRAGKPSLPG